MADGAIDAHFHCWRYDAADYGWIEPASLLAVDCMPDMLIDELDHAGVTGAVAVQARQTIAETRWLLELADAHSWILGVIGWADLRAPDLPAQLDALRHPKLVGFRHVLQDEPAAMFHDRGFVAGVKTVLRRDLAYDLLIRADQLPQALRLAEAVGPGRIVLDHGGKPPIAEAAWQPWAEQIEAMARYPHIACKLSGLVTEAGLAGADDALLEPYMAHLLACFGPDRLIYGSDWPVCRLVAGYADVHALACRFVERHCPAARDAIFGGNARRLYRVIGSA